MADSVVKPKVKPKPKPKPKPKSARSSSGVELNVHSSFYGDFFLLRTPITINGRPAVIKTVNGEPVLRVRDVSVKLSAILKEVVAPVTRKHGVYSVTNFYYEQVALFLASFNSKESLKKFLTDKEAVEKEVSSAIGKLFKEEAKSSKQPQSSRSPSVEQFHVAVDMKVYLVSPAVGRQPTVNKINLANHSMMVETWKRSKLVVFTNTMFTKPPPSILDISGDQTLVPISMGNTSEAASISSNSLNQEKVHSVENGENAELAALHVELKGVTEWFSLGVQLKIPTDELTTIREDYRYTNACQLQMLIRWGQLEKPTWAKVVTALVNIGRRDIAKKVAEKHGVPVPAATEAPPVHCQDEYVGENLESAGSRNRPWPSATDPENSGESLLLLEGEVERATQSRDAVSKALEMDIYITLPELVMKVSSLNEEVRLLKTKLRNREEESEMLDEAKQSLNPEWNEAIQRTQLEKSEAIKVLREIIKEKEDELAHSKAQLADKDKELSKKMKELDVKSARVLELQDELEEMRRKFSTQQEEMDKKLIESVALAQSREKYMEELKIQRDIAVKEASKKKEEIQSYTRELTDKKEQISRLSKKIAEQEREMAKLREELDSHHHNSEQPSVEQTREDDEREQQLLTLMMSAKKLQLELQQTKDKKNQDEMNLERAKEKYKRMLNPSKISWRAAKSAPRDLIRYVDAAVDGDTVYFRHLNTPRFYAYNSTNNTWCELPDAGPTSHCSITVINGTLTAVGGKQDQSGGWWTNQLFSLSDGRRKWVETLPPMPEEGDTRTVCCGTHLIVALTFSSSIYIMDITSHKWSKVSNQPCCSLRSLVMCGEHLYFVYEYDNDNRVFRCSTSDLIQSTESNETGFWELEHTGLLSFSAYVAIHGRLISVGGKDSQGAPTTAVRMYSPTTNTWGVIGHMKTPRSSCFAAVLPNYHLLVAGGLTTGGTCTSEVEIATVHLD